MRTVLQLVLYCCPSSRACACRDASGLVGCRLPSLLRRSGGDQMRGGFLQGEGGGVCVTGEGMCVSVSDIYTIEVYW